MRPSRENSSVRHVMFGTLMRSSSFSVGTCQMRMSSKPHVANSSELPLRASKYSTVDYSTGIVKTTIIT